MKFITHALAVMVLTGLSACSGTINLTPPHQTSIINSYTFESNYEKTWLLVVDFLAFNNININKIEKTSGFISAKFDRQRFPQTLDCGKVEASTLATIRQYKETAGLNITVRKISGKTTRVNVNISGSYTGMGYDDGWENHLPFSGNCMSTGIIEKSLREYISTMI